MDSRSGRGGAMTRVVGLDIGGAHLKVAVAEVGVLTAVRQIACPLWRGVDELERALETARPMIGDDADIRITMTGELADVFPDRHTGVVRIVEVAAAKLGQGIRIWDGSRAVGGLAPFVSPTAAPDRSAGIASANFLATAALVARRLDGPQTERGHSFAGDRGLLIDIGSTTADIVPFRMGFPDPRERSDAKRLISGELVYAGLTRTPVAAVTTRGVFDGVWQTLTREPFATMADVYRVLGTLPDGLDQMATADGRSTSREDSTARLARMFGRDTEPGEEASWMAAARHIAASHLRAIEDGCLQVLSAEPDCGRLIVSAGIGASLAVEIARRSGATHVPFAVIAGVSEALAERAGQAAPATALALL
ncbi:MAG: hypothetical protein K2Y05_04830 [Hyphomicrobiaceae bacterium]|nr:hypothetical protein [Hyphomicrobiaceae bacterium]